MSKNISDIKYGNKTEKKIMPILEEHFKITLNKTGRYDIFDFHNKEKKILIEVKSRRCVLNQYSTTMIGLNKFKEGYKKQLEGYTIYFVFQFLDKIGYYKLEKNSNFTIKDGGRSDRGRAEIKKYVYIPIDELINLY
jgi:hypothetical protein